MTNDTFEQEVLEAKNRYWLISGQPGVGPCQMVGPIIEEIAEERTDIKVCKIDVDENPEIARQYKVFSIPMLFVFKNGEVAARTVGAQSKEAILEML